MLNYHLVSSLPIRGKVLEYLHYIEKVFFRYLFEILQSFRFQTWRLLYESTLPSQSWNLSSFKLSVVKWYMQRYMIIILNDGLINRRQWVVLSGYCLSLVDMQAAVQKVSIVYQMTLKVNISHLVPSDSQNCLRK